MRFPGDFPEPVLFLPLRTPRARASTRPVLLSGRQRQHGSSFEPFGQPFGQPRGAQLPRHDVFQLLHWPPRRLLDSESQFCGAEASTISKAPGG